MLDDHALLESTVSNINVELEAEKEKTRKTLKLAYLLRLEIAKQKTLIAEQQVVIQARVRNFENFRSLQKNGRIFRKGQKFKWPYFRLHNTYALCFWYDERYCQLPYQKSSMWVVRYRTYKYFNFWFVPEIRRFLHGLYFEL